MEKSPELVVVAPAKQLDYGFLPMPPWCRFDPARPFEFSWLLNAGFAAAGTFTVANLYYVQPILVEMSRDFNVPYEEVTNVPSLLQAGYCVGLVFLTPLGDLVPRRPFLLLLIFLTASLSLGLAATNSFTAFSALSFLTGLFSVTPQIFNPLAADLAPPHRRAQAVSIVVSGLLTGMMFARLFAGIITRFSGSFKNVYWMAAGTQYLTLFAMWASLPNYPKKETGRNYFQILWSMVKLMCTQPLLVQACLVGYASCVIFVSWWTTLTFLLTESPFQYNTVEIGLFGLCGIGSIVAAPYVGKLNDCLLPWVGTLCGLLLQLSIALVSVGAAGVSLGAVIVVCICTDIAQQMQQIGNQTRIYSIDPLSRGRLNGCYMTFVFLGQATGSAAGTKIFLDHGWRACYALSVGFSCLGICVLLARGPRGVGWVGWGEEWSLRKEVGQETVVEGEGIEKGEKEGKEGV